MSEPCFWYVNNGIISAVCVECQKAKELDAWYWAGDELGYGDYDLECLICKSVINKRKNKETNE